MKGFPNIFKIDKAEEKNNVIYLQFRFIGCIAICSNDIIVFVLKIRPS